ncbi:MATE family efflux transporter [Nordella sp. HKS 07]|uniref:MATE family efflux transporter n=1 Tax=Nordella sp. HKS 07 TaxID=2712222 RepID=UPI0013E199DE|nr:MATE family efflux transporter [Nordella sp. HKS 07]QIG51624.1 MATE family efflux transporter [Nordella sp. HKS 07]
MSTVREEPARPQTVPQPDSAGAGAPVSWKESYVAILQLAWPLVLTNFAQAAMIVTDVVFIGRLGPQALAASSLAVNIYHTFAFFAFGLVSAVTPMVAREKGGRARDVRQTRRIVRQGLWTAVMISAPAMLLLWHGTAFLAAIGQEPALVEEAGRFLRALLWAMPSFLGFVVLRSFISALERPGWALVMSIAAILVNALGNWLLIFGNWGFPALGIMGSGLASAIASLLMFLGLASVLMIDRRFRRYHVFGRFWRADWGKLKAIWVLGLPIGAIIAFETTIFNAAAFLMGWLGEAELAAHAVAIQVVTLAFMTPLGIAQAATVRVGLAYGAGDPLGVSRAGWSAFILGTSFMVLTATAMIAIPHTLIGIFLDLGAPGHLPVLALATTFLAVAAVFQLVDAGQVLAAGMLRGLHDTRVPMWYAAIGYWGIGLPLSFYLSQYTSLGGIGVWVGLASGIAAVAVLMVRRWLNRERLGLIRPLL